MDMKLLRKRSPVPTLVLAAMSGLLTVAQATALQSGAVAPSRKVSYGDLNLTTPEGAGILYQRIRGAARSVCGDQGRTLFEQSQWTSCVSDAISRAVAEVDNPGLTSIHGSRGGAGSS